MQLKHQQHVSTLHPCVLSQIQHLIQEGPDGIYSYLVFLITADRPTQHFSVFVFYF